MFNVYFFPQIVPFVVYCGTIWYSQTGHGRYCNTANAHCKRYT